MQQSGPRELRLWARGHDGPREDTVSACSGAGHTAFIALLQGALQVFDLAGFAAGTARELDEIPMEYEVLSHDDSRLVKGSTCGLMKPRFEDSKYSSS